jgi:polyphosphate kinase
MNMQVAKKKGKAVKYTFFDRDLSWLSFNERVLTEASRDTVPLMERIKFLAIYSSNLDEFYRVRIPALKALHKLTRDKKNAENDSQVDTINRVVMKQQTFFGSIIREQILPALRQHNIHLVYN